MVTRRRCPLAPRVVVYPQGLTPPCLEQGWLALAQLPQRAGEGVVFGDGSHPTTRLCAGALDLLCRLRRPRAVLDVGTGSGVLARIARARGAAFVVGTDIDPLALSCARAHAELDGHAVEIRFGDEPPDHWGPRFDLIVANVLEGPLRSLAEVLTHALAPGGVLLLSGFTRLQTPALGVTYQGRGLVRVSESHLEEWALLRLDRT
jgi:ribosomal protein L11 methyltransferase